MVAVGLPGDHFDSEKPGPDHLSVTVASRVVLEDVRQFLTDRGVVYGPGLTAGLS